MPRWQLESEHLITPHGRRIALKAIEDWILSAWSGRQAIQTEHWRGWRIVQQYLVPPGRTLRTGGLHINNVRSLAFQIEAAIREERQKRVWREQVSA